MAYLSSVATAPFALRTIQRTSGRGTASPSRAAVTSSWSTRLPSCACSCSGGPLPLFVAEEHVEELTTRFRYIFDESVQPPPGTSAPDIDLSSFKAGDEVSIAGFALQPIAFPHGNVRSYGFRMGKLGVIVDAASLPAEAYERLLGVEVLVINALWRGKGHPTHFNVERAVEAIQSLGVRRAYLTHLTHRVEYHDLLSGLPDGIEPAYDGLVVDID